MGGRECATCPREGLNMRGLASPLEYGASIDVPCNVMEFRQLCCTG